MIQVRQSRGRRVRSGMSSFRASSAKVLVAALLGWGVVTADHAPPPAASSPAWKPLTRETIAAAIKAKQDAKRRPAFTVTMGAAGQAAPVTATLRDTLTGDVNTNGQPDPGDTLTYTATI